MIAFGPEITCTKDLIGVKGYEWSLQLRNFVNFEECAALQKFDRYVLVNSLGDGRVLSAQPSLLKSATGDTVRGPVEPSFPASNPLRSPRFPNSRPSNGGEQDTRAVCLHSDRASRRP